MLPSLAALKDLIGTGAIMALLSVAFGAALRWTNRLALAQAALGALFGGVAVLAVFASLEVAPGVIVDLGGVPVALAGAFLGWPGALVTTGLASAARALMGGAVTAGVLGIVMAAGAGLLWAFLQRGRAAGERRGLLGLALGSSAYVLSIFLLPWDVAWPALKAVAPFLVPFHVVGVLAVGSLLERERRLAADGRRLARAATRDPLTGLLNRRGFEEAVARRLPARPAGEAAAREVAGAAVLLLDLDRFKAVNDTWGHAAGDAVLAALGPRLALALRSEDVLARFGGEEMAAFLPGLTRPAAEATARRLCAAVRAEPFRLSGGRALDLTASVGVAWTAGPVGIDALLLRADLALYAAKDEGRDRVRAAPTADPDLPQHLALSPAPDLPAPAGRRLSA